MIKRNIKSKRWLLLGDKVTRTESTYVDNCQAGNIDAIFSARWLAALVCGVGMWSSVAQTCKFSTEARNIEFDFFFKDVKPL